MGGGGCPGIPPERVSFLVANFQPRGHDSTCNIHVHVFPAPSKKKLYESVCNEVTNYFSHCSLPVRSAEVFATLNMTDICPLMVL